ncbi:hypothetical protein [Marinobacter sp.]|jgi:hypothetical protein|uniref:hypothetical protein n=1 Tax=Marinobacter sp. TaxID=50741 RepID=UPI000C942E37|nr:hypothetical protein [Marinobacter sp.]MAK52260.1 hypothetical protein [Marinobacter sp.]
MGFNRIPLALKFDDATGNSTGLIEFTPNLSDLGDVCLAVTGPSTGQLLGYDGDKWCVTSISTGGGGGGASVTGVPTGNLGQIVTYASLNTPQALSPTATPLNLATTGIVETQIQDSLVGYATTAFTDTRYNTTATFYSTTATLLEEPSTGSNGDLLLYANNNQTATTGVAAFIADQDIVVDSDLTPYATTAFTDAKYNTTATFYSTTATLLEKPETGSNGDILLYANNNDTNTTSVAAFIADQNIVVDSDLTPYATTAFTDAKYNTTATFYSTTATLLEKPSAGSNGDILLYANNNDTNTTSVAAFIADQDLVVDSDLNAYATTAFTDSRYNTTATFYATTATLATNANLAATAAAAVQVADTTANSRAFLATNANVNDLANVDFNDTVKTELLIRNSDTIFASALNEGAITMLFGSDGAGGGEIDFTPSSSGGGSTLISENISGTNVSADNLSVPDYTSLTGAGVPMVLHRQVGAPVASSNSTSLAELVSYTLPANILTLGDIDIMIRGRQFAQGSNLRFNFKIAGTNILNSQISQGTYSDFTRYTMHIQISKMATDRQMVTANFRQGTGTGAAAGFSNFGSTHRDGLAHGEATGDESGTLALSLEAQQSNSSQTVTVDQFRVTLIPDPA